MSAAHERPESGEPIAIVGLSCRLPGARDPEEFWRLLAEGRAAVGEVPAGRWPGAAAEGLRRGGFLDQVDAFDPDFFGIAPAEAAAMDPQQRLALELAWEAVERARLAPDALRGERVGVYVGAINADYAQVHDRLGAANQSPYTVTGTGRSLIANRISYLLGLRGPSLTVDCGQSSSLVAVQLACADLRRGQVPTALVGGVQLNLLPETSEALGRFGALSPNGRSHVLDHRANGYVRGEGGGFLVLRPLSAALAAGDHVHCVILGGAVNNDGGGHTLTAPRAEAQTEVIRLALAQAGVAPEQLGYVELHGTGTPLGDPVEAAALGEAVGRARSTHAPLAVGSVKTNIGHLEGAAGIAGLLKTALCLSHGSLVPSLNFERPNPRIPLDELGLRVVQEAEPWPVAGPRPIAGVSSFGMGGTNCHLVLAAAPEPATPEPADARLDGGDAAPLASAPLPLLLSARSPGALRAQADALAEALAAPDAPEAADVALSLLRTRSRFEHRGVVLGEQPADLVAGLQALAAGRIGDDAVTGSALAGRRAFVFPGQGSQWPEMARALAAESEVFATRLAQCAEALSAFVDFDVLAVLRGEDGAPDLSRVDVVQPALWAVMVSIAALWQSHGVQPDLVIGHSQGEIAAATAIGALSLEDAARVVALRSQAVRRVTGGGMLSAAACAEDVLARVPADSSISVAAVNGPRSTVVSGPVAQLEALAERLEADGLRAKLIQVDYASHSPAVEVLREQILADLAPIRPRSVPTAFYSTFTGEPVDTATLDAEYWYSNLRHPVRFADAVRRAGADGCVHFVECSPHPLLTAAVEEIGEAAGLELAAVGTLRRGQGGPVRVLRSMAAAYTRGLDAGLDAYCVRPGARITDLPTYRFQRTRHWLDGVPAGWQAPVAAPAGATTPAATAGSTPAQLRELVLSTAADLLGLGAGEEIDPSRTFKDLGFDSVTTVELRTRLQALTGLRLPTTLLFDHPTPRQLADGLHARSAGRSAEIAVPAFAAASAPSAGQPEADPVVIVGMACRYPGDVGTPEELWRLAAEGTDAITPLPTNRGWDLDALFGPGDGRPGTCATRFGGFLHDADRFDAGFFGLSPREALAMDPQQRLLLEIAWEALERTGIDPGSLAETPTGVFVGAMAADYGPRLHQPGGAVDGHLLTGTATSVASGRIAYTFGLRGPAITVDTACSSSLVAIHLATQSLRRGECSLALAGGATLMSSPGNLVEFSRQNGLSVDGRAKAFAASADGTVFAEGAGIVLLERLSDARRHGHPVLAVVRGIAVNSDGASNGLSAPSGPAQQQVIRQALADARLRGSDVDALEAHGTGTALGDPIEAGAVLATYGQDRAQDAPLWLGSVKSNIGHSQAAAGVAGVIKMVMAMRHGVLPPTLHADEPTTKVDWDAGHVRLLTRQQPWRTPGRPRRAAVSGFGISGTNAHLILEAAPATDEVSAPRAPQPPALVWVLTARSAASLRGYAERLHAFALSAAEPDLVQAGAALARRTAFPHRAVVIAADRDELCAALRALADDATHPGLHRGVANGEVHPVFVFPGQGAQWVGMAAELIEANPVFAAALGDCSAALEPYTGWSVLDILTGVEGAPTLDGTEVVQPVLFAVMVALARLWQSVGVQPAAVVGHSQGEIAAALVAGALSAPDAAKVIALRSRVLAGLDGTGGVLAVGAPAARVRERLEPWRGRLWVAVDNGPSGTVVAGELGAIDEFVESCGDSVQLRRTPVAYAAHTPHVVPMREELLAVLADLAPQDTDTAICSSCLGGFMDGSALTADYWYRNVEEQVSFDAAIRAFAGTTRPLFIEVSSHPILTGAVQDILADAGVEGGAVGTLRRNQGGPVQFSTALAAAFVLGAPIAWSELLGPVTRHLDLPTYPFDRRRYWLTGPDAGNAVSLLGHPLMAAAVPVARDGGMLLTGRLSRTNAGWLADHAVHGTALLPGTGFVEIALRAAAVSGADQVEDLTLHAPLLLPETGAMQLQATVTGPDERGRRELAVYSRPAGDPDAPWTRHADGVLSAAPLPAPERITPWPPTGASAIDLSDAYERLAAQGYDYGPAFRGLTAAWRVGDDLYADVRLPESVAADAEAFGVHPALLDAALHVLVLDALDAPGSADVLLPFSWSGLWLTAQGIDRLRIRLARTREGNVAVTLHDDAGRTIGGAEELTLRPISTGGLSGTVSPDLHHVDWTPAPSYPLAHDAWAKQPWAVLDSGSATRRVVDALRADGLEPERYCDLSALPSAVAPVVVVPFLATGGDSAESADPRGTVRESLGRALELIRRWTDDDRCDGSRLLFLADPSSLVGAPVWGLVRTAITEHPGRFALADLADLADLGDGSPGAAALLVSAVAAGEPQCAVRGGRVLLPRVAKLSAADAGPSEPLDLTSGTVLVTGGTSGLGTLVAERLAERHGVRDLLLVSRSGADAPGAEDLTRRLTALGASVRIAACDLAERADLTALLASIPPERPLIGVVHAAGVLDDATVTALDEARLDRALRPKLDAGWLLHELTAGLPLRMFVLFSSVAGVLGNAGQGNYAAANAFLDALAEHRHGLGLPAQSVAWGLWSTPTGMTSALSEADLVRLAGAGLVPLSAPEGLDLFSAVLTGVGADRATTVATRWDTSGLRARAESADLPAVLRGLVRTPRRAATPATGGAAAQSGHGGRDTLTEHLARLDRDTAVAEIFDFVRDQVAYSLGHVASDGVDPDRPLRDQGLDSLMSVELRNRLGAETGLRLPASLAFDHPTVTALSGYLAGELVPAEPSADQMLREALERIAGRFAEADADERERVSAVLHETLKRFGIAPEGADPDEPRFGSDEEMYAFIDGRG